MFRSRTIVLFCLLAQTLFLHATSLPFSGRAAPAGKLNMRLHSATGGSSSSDAVLFGDSPPTDAVSSPLSMFGYGCSCTRSGPSSEELDQLKGIAVKRPHPLLLFSEMAESVHRNWICRDTACAHHPLSEQSEQDIVAKVTDIMLDYLNSGIRFSEKSCSLVYNITYNPRHYPRYRVELLCARMDDDSTLHSCRCSECGGCSLNQYQMIYLTSDPHEPGCEEPSDEELTWKLCTIDVGSGCKC